MLHVIKQLQIEKRIRAGYGAAFIVLFISYLLTLYANRQLMDQTKTLIRTNNIINNLEYLISGVKDAETGARGYILINDKKFLDPYHASFKNVDSTFSLLKLAYAKNDIKIEEINNLKKLVDKRYEYLGFTINYVTEHKNAQSDTLTKIAYDSKAIMDSIRHLVTNLQFDEKNLLIHKTAVLNDRYATTNIFIIISVFLAFLFAYLGWKTYTKENTARKIADNQVIEFQKQLQLRIKDLDKANKELVQMRLDEKFAATGRIARNIAHEVRNPLTNIDLAIGQIQSEIPDLEENFSVLFDMVNRNSRRINQLITELLNATRFAELNYQPVSINLIIDEALELAKDRIALTHIKIEKNYSIDICDIPADKEKVKIAFLNMIVNAVEAIEGEGGILKINTRGEAGKCVVEIIDNGVGMDKESLGKLFEPYFTTKQKGNGLGLTNTQNIILNHKGTIEVDSTRGKGTTIILKFDFTTG